MGQMGRLYVYTVALNWFDSNIPYHNAGDSSRWVGHQALDDFRNSLTGSIPVTGAYLVQNTPAVMLHLCDRREGA